MKRLLLACPVLLPLVAFCGARDDYATQWPLTLHDADVGAYRVALDREVYRSVQSRELRDVDVINAGGAPVPAALFAAGQSLAQSPRHVVLPWFPLPAGRAAQAQDLTVISERDPDGNLLRIEARGSTAPLAAATASDAWLIDAGGLHGDIVALELDWDPPAGGMDSAYRVEGSDDMRSWRVLQPHAQLLDLVRDGRHLRQRRIPLDGSARYLRLLPNGAGSAPVLTAIRAELAPTTADLPWRWETLSGRAIVEHRSTAYLYTLGGRFPIERADVALPGNNASEWTLQSRDADDAPWHTRAGPWIAYRIGTTGADRSAAQALGAVTRDRYWRLSSRTPGSVVPTLRLGYRPEVVVFVAQGPAPYALVAGSARAERAQAPVAQLVDVLRVQHGSDWQPADASLATPAMLAGADALRPASVRRDWKAWLLWSVLVAGVLVVATFAFSLLRRPAS
jgi:hypothetical protein